MEEVDIGIIDSRGISSVGPKERVDSQLRVNLASTQEDRIVYVLCMLILLVLQINPLIVHCASTTYE